MEFKTFAGVETSVAVLDTATVTEAKSIHKAYPPKGGKVSMQKAPTRLAQFAQGMADSVVFFILLKLMYTCFKPFTIRLNDNRYRILIFRACNSFLYNALRAKLIKNEGLHNSLRGVLITPP